MGRECYLVCVSASNVETGETINNNKYYHMKENGDGTFTAKYGRIGGSFQTVNYPMSKWSSTYKQKTSVRNGYVYKDMTDLFTEESSDVKTFNDLQDHRLQKLLNDLENFAKNKVRDNYNVNVGKVTKTQIETAQSIIDRLSSEIMKDKWNRDELNKILVELFAVIPRKMDKVSNYLIPNDDVETARHIITKEQDLLDVMAQQVDMNQQLNTNINQTMADVLGIKLEHVTDDEKNKIIHMMGDEKGHFKQAFRVENISTQKRYNDWIGKVSNNKTMLLWHGSRNENWMNIIKTGLLIRPSGVVLTGAMFGNGVYFADLFKKSLGYTSFRGSYWANGSSNKAYLAIYEVHVGKQYVVTTSQPHLDEKKLKQLDSTYDSLFAKKGTSLYNNEYIVYNIAQSTIKYIVEIG